MPTLIFVYNADSGLFNTLADIGHKLFSPETYPCDLCQLTHGVLRERGAWRDFVTGLSLPCRFLHRDQFRAEYPQVDAALPAVFRADGHRIQLCLDAATLAACDGLEGLQSLVRERCLGGV